MRDTRSDPRFMLSAPLSGGQGEEAGVDGVHAKVAHHFERCGENRNPVAGGRQSTHLIFKTAADPNYCVSQRRDGAHP